MDDKDAAKEYVDGLFRAYGLDADSHNAIATLTDLLASARKRGMEDAAAILEGSIFPRWFECAKVIRDKTSRIQEYPNG